MSLLLRDYNSAAYGPFLGVSDEGSAAEAICEAASNSPKAKALGDPGPLITGVAHDAERLGSVGEVPVGPEEYDRIRAAASGRVLITTNVGSHVNLWHYQQPPTYLVDANSQPADVQTWARAHGKGLWSRQPQPWLRLRFAAATSREVRIAALQAANAEAPVAIAVQADHGVEEAREAISVGAGVARGVVVDGTARPPTEGRPALPGLLNYFDVAQTRELIREARNEDIAIEPALKFDTDSVANQVWAGLYTARAMGLDLGKYGLFPLTFEEMGEVVNKVQHWIRDWTAAPAFYIDVPSVEDGRVYELDEAADATGRWLQLMAECGAKVVLVDTVDKSRGHHLVRSAPADEMGIFTWEEIEALQQRAERSGVHVLWAGGIQLDQVREFGQRRAFGVYVTTAAAQSAALDADQEHDIGLTTAKEPVREKIAVVKLLLEAGFLGDQTMNADVDAAEKGDAAAAKRLTHTLIDRWRKRTQEPEWPGPRGS